MPRNGIRNPAEPSSNADRTLHNCPPSQWRFCAGCRRLVYVEDIHLSRHARFVGRRVIDCGPTNGKVILRGGTPSLVRRMN